MAIKKTKKGWIVDVQPGGRGSKRYRKTEKTLAEAKGYEAWLKTQINQNPEWRPEKKDSRKLLDLVNDWHKQHGVNLKSQKDTYARLIAMCKEMNNPIASKFSAQTFAEYRTKRIESGLTANNMNREHSYLKAVFNYLIRTDQWKLQNPLAKLKQIKIDSIERDYLTSRQIEILLEKLSGEAKLISKICLSCGARWSEAQNIKITHLKDGKISFVSTKNGKIRAIPIEEKLITELKEFLQNKYGEKIEIAERFFEAGEGSYEKFRETIIKTEIKLKKGQATHVLRHYPESRNMPSEIGGPRTGVEFRSIALCLQSAYSMAL